MNREKIFVIAVIAIITVVFVGWQLVHMGVLKIGFTNRFNKNSKKRFVSNSSSYYKK